MTAPQDLPPSEVPTLPPANVGAVGLAALLRQDQRRRWLRGQRLRVEDYLERYPALRANPGALLDLVYGEFALREEMGESPDVVEYLARFPEHAGALRRQFELHWALVSGGAPPSAAGNGEPASKAATLPSPAPVGAPGAATLPPMPAQDVVLPATGPLEPGSPSKVVPPPLGVAMPGYEVLGVLGKGGMGVVYKARQVGLNRLVALKMILHAGHPGDDARQRFRVEAEAIARLKHPHIVQIYEVGEHAGVPFFSLEFCPGGSLADQLKGTPWSPARAARMVEVLAHAIHAAHHAQVIHRDLKPANVLLAEGGHPKITDFGLAKKLDELGQTQTGDVMGTPPYMAPEQAGGRKDIGPPTDVYALGAILYELLTGRPPFLAVTATDTLMQVLNEEPVPVCRLQPKVPRDLETVCLRCLEKEPARRYPSAQALAEDLRRFLEGDPISSMPIGGREWLERWALRVGYELLEELGRGGSGVVYKARQQSLQRLVALKMLLHAEYAGHHERQRFRAKAEAVARLRHPHIVQVYDFGERAGLPYFSMELVEGGSLADRIANGPLTPAEAARLIETLALVMHYAHRQGLVHRNLKPADVLLTADGTPKITDFGLVGFQNPQGEDLDPEGTIVAVPGYIAPEQATGKYQECGPPTDVYCLGAMLYELLTGQPPIKAATALDTILQVIHDEPVPVRRLRPDVPRDLETVCLQCLQKDPNKRYVSAEGLAEDLRRFQRAEPVAARPVGPVSRIAKWGRCRPGVAALLGLVAAGARWWRHLRHGRVPPPKPRENAE
jgi:serine/threonine protein kinase